MANNTVYNKKTKNTILPSLDNFITNIKVNAPTRKDTEVELQSIISTIKNVYKNKCFEKKSLIMKHNVRLSIQFVTGVTQELKAGEKSIFKQNLKSDFNNVVDHKSFPLNKEHRKYEQIKYDLQAKIGRKNQIEHYFNVVNRQLQFIMKKKITKSEAIIVAAMKEHEHKIVNLQLDANSWLSKIESNAKNNEIKKNSRMQIRNDLKIRKALIVHTYDSEMMAKYNNVNGFNSKIKTIEDTIYQLQESISLQMPFYNNVVLEKEEENDRIWQAKLHEIQRKIAARKIQMHFRRYLNYIKTRDIKKNKKGQHKKNQPKMKNN